MRLSKIVRARVQRGANADSDQAAFFARCGLFLFPFVPANFRFGHLQHLGIVSRVVHATVRSGVGEFFWANVVAQAHFVGRDAEFVPANVNNPLQEPEMLHTRVAAIRSHWTFVCDRLHEINARVLEAINSRKDLRPNHAAQWLITRVCPTVINVAGRQRGDDAVVVEGDSCVTECPPSLPWALEVMCSERVSTHLIGLPPVFFEAQRANRHLRIAGDLDAKTAANIGGLYADPVDVNAQVGGQKLNSKRWK